MGGRRRAGLSAAFDDQQGKRIVHQFRHGGDVASPRGRQVATSAPVNVPDWSKIYRVVSVESMHNDDSDYESSSDQMVPPHEYLARSHSNAILLSGNPTTVLGIWVFVDLLYADHIA
ncbi:putative senescence regulator S40 [Tanacetum coccineum]